MRIGSDLIAWYNLFGKQIFLVFLNGDHKTTSNRPVHIRAQHRRTMRRISIQEETRLVLPADLPVHMGVLLVRLLRLLPHTETRLSVRALVDRTNLLHPRIKRLAQALSTLSRNILKEHLPICTQVGQTTTLI